MSYGLLLLRAVIGLTFFAHGAQKVFGWFGGRGLDATASFFGSVGWKASKLMALLAGASEAGGLLFALGLATPLAAAGLVAVMTMAILTVHLRKGFWNNAGGYEFNLVLLTVPVAVTMAGPGRFSLDRLIGWDDDITGLWWGIGAAAVGIVGALATRALFHAPRPAPAEQP